MPPETTLDGSVDTSLISSPNFADKPELRLWLRLLTCTNLIEGEIRRRLRQVRCPSALVRATCLCGPEEQS